MHSKRCKKQKTYFNLEEKSRTLFDAIKWLLSRKPKPWPKQTVSIKTVKPDPIYLFKDKIKVTFVGHSTFLIQTDSFNILTDPVWADYAGPTRLLSVKRMKNPGVILEEVPKLDLILLTHNHYDHMDKKTLTYFAKRDNPLIVTSMGIAKDLVKCGFTHVKELEWWQKVDLWNGCSVELVPAQHFSGRYIIDSNKSLWGGFILQIGEKQIYYAGDTGYGSHFKTIKEKFPHIDIAFLPIGIYEPSWFMSYVHMSPLDAVRAHIDLLPQISIGMHFGTFRLADESIDDPIKDLAKANSMLNVKSEAFVAIEEGKWLEIHIESKK